MQLTSAGSCAIINHVAAVMQQTKYKNADMAESADALASGASPRKGVEVQVLLSAPKRTLECSGVLFLSFYGKTGKELQMQALSETKRLFLREWTMQDLDAWAAILSDAEVMRYYPKPFDRQNVQDWIAWNLENYRTDGFGLWAVHLRATGELLGDCGITMQQIHGQRLPEIGFHMKKSVWGQGYATEAAKACLAWGMQQTDFPAFYCYQKSTNLPSRRVAEKLGMTLQEIYADPVNTFTSVYAITRAEFFAKVQNALQ